MAKEDDGKGFISIETALEMMEGPAPEGMTPAGYVAFISMLLAGPEEECECDE